MNLNNLTDLSRNSSHDFEKFFNWGTYSCADGEYFMPPELLSIYGTPLYATLNQVQIRELTRIEVIQVLYLYLYTESVMCYYLARHLVNADVGSLEHAFVLREQIEEYRHQDMFLRGLEILGMDFRPMSRFTRWWTGLEALVLPARYFFLLQISIELISREIGKLTFPDERINRLVRDMSLMHEREESRHIAFSDAYIQEGFQGAGFLTRTFGGICIALNIAFVNYFYIYPGMYSKAGIQDDTLFYKTAKAAIRQSAIKNMLTGSSLEFLKKHNWITWANAWIWLIFTGITREKLYGKN